MRLWRMVIKYPHGSAIYEAGNLTVLFAYLKGAGKYDRVTFRSFPA